MSESFPCRLTKQSVHILRLHFRSKATKQRGHNLPVLNSFFQIDHAKKTFVMLGNKLAFLINECVFPPSGGREDFGEVNHRRGLALLPWLSAGEEARCWHSCWTENLLCQHIAIFLVWQRPWPLPATPHESPRMCTRPCMWVSMTWPCSPLWWPLFCHAACLSILAPTGLSGRACLFLIVWVSVRASAPERSLPWPCCLK